MDNRPSSITLRAVFLFPITLLTLLYGIRIRIMYRICVRDMRNAYYHKQKMKGTYSWYLLGNAIMIVATLLIDKLCQY